MKINREIYSPTRSLWIRPESLFLFFQYQGLRVIFVRQHSLFEFEGLFQLGVYNLIIVIQTLRNKAMNRGTFWKGVWVVFIVFFSLSSWGFFFAPVEKSRGRPIKGWTHANCYSRASKACCNARNWECRCKRVQTNSSIMCGSLCFFVFFATFLWCSDSAEISLNFRYSS